MKPRSRRGPARNYVEVRMIEYLARRLGPTLAQVPRWERTHGKAALEQRERR